MRVRCEIEHVLNAINSKFWQHFMHILRNILIRYWMSQLRSVWIWTYNIAKRTANSLLSAQYRMCVQHKYTCSTCSKGQRTSTISWSCPLLPFDCSVVSKALKNERPQYRCALHAYSRIVVYNSYEYIYRQRGKLQLHRWLRFDMMPIVHYSTAGNNKKGNGNSRK